MTSPSVPIEGCREWVDTDRCPARAEFILWGKLFKREALGPRCYEHAAQHIGHGSMSRLDQWAVYDLRRANTLADANASYEAGT